MAAINLQNVSVSYYLRKSRTRDTNLDGGSVGAHILVGQRYLEIAALQDVSLSLANGDRVGIIGTNGSGKSTLLKLCAGAVAAQSGKVEIDGVVSAQFALGSGLRSELSGRQNAALKCLYLDVPQSLVAEYVEDLKRISGLGSYFELPLSSYSAGMKSRFVMSLLRLVRGEILIMDEWINAVDPTLNETIDGLQTQLIERSKILLLASHSERVLRQWVNKIIWLERGTLEAFGPIEDVLKDYQVWMKNRK